jgi:membrane-associated phospholipid phosphatase
MEEIHHLEIIINIFLQSLGGWLVLPMQVFTALGQEEFYMLVLPAIYWCINPRLGVRVGFMLILTTSLNNWLKLAFASPRPYWIDTRVKGIVLENSFGLPSGHAMNSTSLWGFWASQVRKRWFTILIVAIVFLIGVSRIALGVHFTSDVVVGWLVGGLLLSVFLKWEKPAAEWIQRMTLARQIWLAVISSLFILAISFGVQALDANWQPSPDWPANIPGIAPLDPNSMVTLAGTWLGLAASLAWLYRKHRFINPPKTFGRNLLRYLVGAAGVALIWFGLGAIFPRTLDFISLTLRYTRYVLVGGWVGALAPLLFLKLKV